MRVSVLATKSSEELIDDIARFFREQRNCIEKNGRATSKACKGSVPPNPIADADITGHRRSLIDGNEIEIRNVTSSDFSLYIKHPAFFTAALPILVKHFPCFALIRNPLAVIPSWRNSAGMAVGNGRMPAAEAFDLALAQALTETPDPLARQFILLDYCFSQYEKYLSGRLLKYEDLVATGGKALALLSETATQLIEPLESRNHLMLLKDSAALAIAKALVERESPCWRFYSRNDIASMLT